MNNIYAFLISALAVYLFIRIAPYQPRLSGRRDDLKAVQSAHTKLTPRVGGVSVAIALVAMLALLPPDVAQITGLLLLGAIPVFASGLLEDLGYGIPPRGRLMAAFSSTALLIWLSGAWIKSLGIMETDFIFANPVVGGVFTLLVLAGITNAFNLIDGINGFASGTAIVAAVTLGLIAQDAGLTAIAALSYMLAAACLGFFVFNWPRGLIFMGDGGAYLIGFALGWIGVWILNAAPEVAPWSIVLTLFWPIFEFLYSIVRRTAQGKSSMHPDRMHMHQIAMRYLLLTRARDRGRLVANSTASALLLPLVAIPAVCGYIMRNHNEVAMLAAIGLGFGFITLRQVLIRKARTARVFGRIQFVSLNDDAIAEDVSPFSGIYIQDSISVMVDIRRASDSRDWVLSTTADGSGRKVWPGVFSNDDEAWHEFMSAARKYGMDYMVE